jgi:hypothetical protein
MFRRRRAAGGPAPPLRVLDESERQLVLDWWELAAERLEAGHRDTSWLTGTILVEITVGYAAERGKGVEPFAYAVALRAGYALRMFVDMVAPAQPLDVSEIDPESVATLASFPRDDEAGTLALDAPPEYQELTLPIVVLVTETAELGSRFEDVVAVEPALWNACVELGTDRLQTALHQQGRIRRRRDLDSESAGLFLRYGFVLRCFDEAFGINGSS